MCKFWGVNFGCYGPKSTIEENSFEDFSQGEMTAKKWLDSIEKQKRRSNLKERDRHPDRQTESIVDNNDS